MGNPSGQVKHLTWDRLRNLRSVVDMPWMVIGDLNEILYPFKKEGGRDRSERYMQAFRSALDDCNLSDFGYTGDKFTWHRGQIRPRLDRALTNDAWYSMFSNAKLENREYNRSDHRPLLNNQGNWVEGTAYLNLLILDYFASLFTTEVDEPDPDLIGKVTPKVSAEMNEAILTVWNGTF